MELPLCPVCGSSNKQPVWATQAYELIECSDCRLVYKSRCRSEDLRQLNEQLYRDDFIRDRGWAKRRLLHVARRRIELLKRYLSAGKILEVGGGTGEFIEAAQRQGYSVETVELSRMLSEYVSECYSVRCYNGTLEDAPEDFSGYDMVAAFDVMEHLADPVSFIQSAKARLKPNGILFFEMPMWQSWARVSFRHLWNMVHISDHFLFFGCNSWESLAKQTQLKTVSFGTCEASWEWVHAMLFAVLNIRRIRSGFFSPSLDTAVDTGSETKDVPRFRRFLTRECPARFAQLTSPLTWPIRRWIDYQCRGTEMSVLAKVIS